VSFYKHGNEPSYYKKGWSFVSSWATVHFSSKDLESRTADGGWIWITVDASKLKFEGSLGLCEFRYCAAELWMPPVLWCLHELTFIMAYVHWKSLCLTLFLFWFRCSFLPQVKVWKLLEHFFDKDVSWALLPELYVCECNSRSVFQQDPRPATS